MFQNRAINTITHVTLNTVNGVLVPEGRVNLSSQMGLKTFGPTEV